jgi:hypothetical protein
MSLLRDIQDAAVDQSTNVTTLLRKCKILAARLGNEEFKRWIDNELNGYESVDELPEYRIIHTQSYGFFVSPFGLQGDNLPPRNAVVSLVDTVKTRILNFVLGIEEKAPDAGEAPLHQPPLSQETVTQVFNTYITGNVQNVATGGNNFKQQAAFSSGPTDEVFQKLLDAITHVQIDTEVVNKMTAAVQEMRESCGTSRFTEHYNTFMSTLADHIQVFGPLVAPYLPFLAKLLT